ncbi:MAG: hypothetical protein J2P25_12155 [Nocardiopsaceae bacterium]|nr:hypothetical protein [Nocardiopsaceae bacterium]
MAGLAWTPVAALLAGLITAPASYGSARWLASALLLAFGAGACRALLCFRGYSLLKLAELVLAAERGNYVRFLRLLEDAADRQVMRRVGASYKFRDDTVRARLATLGPEALADHARERDRRSARVGDRTKVTVPLPDDTITSISIGIGIGVGITACAGLIMFEISAGAGASVSSELRLAIFGALDCTLVGFCAARITKRIVAGVLRGTAAGARWVLADNPPTSRTVRLVAAAEFAALTVLLTGMTAKVVAMAFPAVLLAACGTWACVLVSRKSRRSRKSPNRWPKFTPGLIAVAMTGACLVYLIVPDLLPAEPTAAVLFPPAVWASILLWRSMSGSGRLAVKAGADITLSLLLGGELVLFLVWLGNLLGLHRAEMAALRAVASRTGSAADLPWWLWTGIYVLLAGAVVASERWPGRWNKVTRWLGRLRVVPVTGAARRTLTCVHIGLLVIVLVGVATPMTFGPTLQRQMKARYTVALQRELADAGEQAAYKEIRSQFTAADKSPALAAVVKEIHDYIGAPISDHDVTRAETSLAFQVGKAQARALALKGPPSLPAVEQSAISQAGFDEPALDVPSLTGLLGMADEQQQESHTTSKRAEEIGDLAASAVASTISIPHISDNEVFQVVREYLGGLIEGSSLKDVFAAWARRLPGASSPPDADTMVIPDPARLDQAAAAQAGKPADRVAADSAPDSAQRELLLRNAFSDIESAGSKPPRQEDTPSCSGCSNPIAPEAPYEDPGAPHEDPVAPPDVPGMP